MKIEFAIDGRAVVGLAVIATAFAVMYCKTPELYEKVQKMKNESVETSKTE